MDDLAFKFLRLHNGNPLCLYTHDFKQAISEDLKVLDKIPEAEDSYFSQLIKILPDVQQSSLDCLRSWIKILQVIAEVDLDRYSEIHKGTPFFFSSAAAYILDDFERALFFMDAALAEDIHNAYPPDHWKTLPAADFILLNRNERNPVDRSLTGRIVDAIGTALEEFKRDSEQTLSLNDFKKYFVNELVRKKTTTVVTALYTFILESKTRQNEIKLRSSHGGTNEPTFFHLFKGCLVFESLLKPDDKRVKDPLGKLLEDPQLRAKLLLYDESYKEFNGKSPKEIFQIMKDWKNAGKLFQDRVIGTTYGLRNATAHSLLWEPLEQVEYQSLYDCIVNANFWAIKKLYIDNPALPEQD